MAGSAFVAAVPLVVVIVLMAGFRKSGLISSAWGFAVTGLLALVVWGMPLPLAAASAGFGMVYAVWPVMYIVFAGLWLYRLAKEAGSFDLLRRWVAEHASGDQCVQALLVAFCFGALLESCAGFGAPVAVSSFLLVALGFEPRKAVLVALLANTAPVGFGSMGIPIVALGDVTGLDRLKLSAMVGRQLPLLSVVIPFCLIWVVAGEKGLKRAWPAALVCGVSYASGQFLVSNFWGPYAADVVAASAAIIAMILLLMVWSPQRDRAEAASAPNATGTGARIVVEQPEAHPGVEHSQGPTPKLSPPQSFAAWLPWLLLTLVMAGWSYWKLFQFGQIALHVPLLHQGVLLTLYNKPYSAIYYFRPLDIGTAALFATAITAFSFRVPVRVCLRAGCETMRQVAKPALTVMLIVGLAYLYNYSGIAYTLGAAMAKAGPFFPVLSSYLGWIGCFLSGSDTASNVLFGNLQVAAAHQLNLSPVLLAGTNSSGGVVSKMISPQNIAVGVTTVGLIGQEGRIVRSTFLPSVLLAAALGLLALAQAYWLTWMVPGAN